MTFTTFKGEKYTVVYDAARNHYALTRIGLRSGKPIRKNVVIVTDDLDGLVCHRHKTACEHTRIVATLLERPANQPPRLQDILIHLKRQLAQYEHEAIVAQRTCEDLLEELVRVSLEDIRPRVLHEFMHVLEQHRLLIRRKKFQCESCILHKSCVIGDGNRQALKCLSYYCFLDAEADIEWYRTIPLSADTLVMLDFPSLLVLAYIHNLAFDTLGDLSHSGFRARLISIENSSRHVLTALR